MLSFKELREKTYGHYISYPELLKTQEWNEKRNVIIRRDHHSCTKCGNEETMSDYDIERRETWYYWYDVFEGDWVTGSNGEPIYLKYFEGGERVSFRIADKPYHLQVHHKRYIKNRLPWDYDDTDLITLCNWCHSEFHQQFDVERYAEDGITLVDDLEVCSRCQGTGNLPEFNHVKGGVCFQCDGERYKLPTVKLN